MTQEPIENVTPFLAPFLKLFRSSDDVCLVKFGEGGVLFQEEAGLDHEKVVSHWGSIPLNSVQLGSICLIKEGILTQSIVRCVTFDNCC